jgi:hypothetical protein
MAGVIDFNRESHAQLAAGLKAFYMQDFIASFSPYRAGLDAVL